MSQGAPSFFFFLVKKVKRSCYTRSYHELRMIIIIVFNCKRYCVALRTRQCGACYILVLCWLFWSCEPSRRSSTADFITQSQSDIPRARNTWTHGIRKKRLRALIASCSSAKNDCCNINCVVYRLKNKTIGWVSRTMHYRLLDTIILRSTSNVRRVFGMFCKHHRNALRKPRNVIAQNASIKSEIIIRFDLRTYSRYFSSRSSSVFDW